MGNYTVSDVVRAKNVKAANIRAGNVEKADAADRTMREAKLTAYISDLVDRWPPLTAEQRDKLALLLRGGAA